MLQLATTPASTTRMNKERMNGSSSSIIAADAETDLRQQQQIFLHQQQQKQKQIECVDNAAALLASNRPATVSVNNSTPTTNTATATATTLITTVHPHDVLCGRRGSNHYRGHDGNKFYRTVICEKQKIYFKYRSASTEAEASSGSPGGSNNANKDREEKSAIIQSVVDAVKNRHPPGRFLKAAPCNSIGSPTTTTQNPSEQPWVLLDRRDCLAKVGHALLDKADRLGLNQYKRQNKMMITNYTSNDILLGNGKKYKIHDGNHWYRELICSQQPSYDISEKLSKMKTQERMIFIQSILDKVEARSPPGRFLQIDCSDSNLWYQIEAKVARKKIRDDMKYRSRFLKMKFLKYGGTSSQQAMASSIVYKARKFSTNNDVTTPPISTQTETVKAKTTKENVVVIPTVVDPLLSKEIIIPSPSGGVANNLSTTALVEKATADVREMMRLRTTAVTAQSEDLHVTSMLIQQQLQRQVTPQSQLERQMQLKRLKLDRRLIEHALQHRQTVHLRLVAQQQQDRHRRQHQQKQQEKLQRKKEEQINDIKLLELIQQEQDRHQLTQQLHLQRQQQQQQQQQQQIEDQRLIRHQYQLEDQRLQKLQQQLEQEQRLQKFQQLEQDQRLQEFQLQQQLEAEQQRLCQQEFQLKQKLEHQQRLQKRQQQLEQEQRLQKLEQQLEAEQQRLQQEFQLKHQLEDQQRLQKRQQMQQLEEQRLQKCQLEEQRLQRLQQLQTHQQQQQEMQLLMHLRQKQQQQQQQQHCSSSSHSVLPNAHQSTAASLRRSIKKNDSDIEKIIGISRFSNEYRSPNNSVLLNYSLMNHQNNKAMMLDEKQQYRNKRSLASPLLSAAAAVIVPVPGNKNKNYSNLILDAAANSSPKRRRIDNHEKRANAASAALTATIVVADVKEKQSFSLPPSTVAPPKDPTSLTTTTLSTNEDNDTMITDGPPANLNNNNNNNNTTDNRIVSYNFVRSESSGDDIDSDSDSETSLVI